MVNIGSGLAHNVWLVKSLPNKWLEKLGMGYIPFLVSQNLVGQIRNQSSKKQAELKVQCLLNEFEFL